MHICLCIHQPIDGNVFRSEKYIQDTPNCIINAQSVVIIIQVQGNGKQELDIKTAKFPDKEEIIFHACLTSCSSRLWECGIYHWRNKRTPCSLFFFAARLRQVILYVISIKTGSPNPRIITLTTTKLIINQFFCQMIGYDFILKQGRHTVQGPGARGAQTHLCGHALHDNKY